MLLDGWVQSMREGTPFGGGRAEKANCGVLDGVFYGVFWLFRY